MTKYLNEQSFGFLALLMNGFFYYVTKYLNTYHILFLINEQSFGFLALLARGFFVARERFIFSLNMKPMISRNVLHNHHKDSFQFFSMQNVLFLNTQRKIGYPKRRQNLIH